jgi:hypothetical protein
MAYLAALPWTWKRFRELEQLHAAPAAGASEAGAMPGAAGAHGPGDETARAPESDSPQVIEIRPGEQKR